MCNKDAFGVDFWALLAIPPPLSELSLTTDSSDLTSLEVASDKLERSRRPTGGAPGDVVGLSCVARCPRGVSPREMGTKSPPSYETSPAMSLTTSHNAIAHYCMQLFR